MTLQCLDTSAAVNQLQERGRNTQFRILTAVYNCLKGLIERHFDGPAP